VRAASRRSRRASAAAAPPPPPPTERVSRCTRELGGDGDPDFNAPDCIVLAALQLVNSLRADLLDGARAASELDVRLRLLHANYRALGARVQARAEEITVVDSSSNTAVSTTSFGLGRGSLCLRGRRLLSLWAQNTRCHCHRLPGDGSHC